MFKHKKILYTLFLLPVCTLFSCQKAKEPYEVKTRGNYPDEWLYVDSTNLAKEITSGESIKTEQIIVKYKDKKIEWSQDILAVDTYFFCTNESFPTNSVVKDLKVTSNTESADLNFFVAHVDVSANTTFVSSKITIKVNNPSALKPWVWFVVTGVVIFGVVAMVFYTKRRKETR